MKRAICIFISMPILIGALIACNQPKSPSPEEAKAIAKEAYLYGFPMVVNYKTMYAFTLDKRNPIVLYRCEDPAIRSRRPDKGKRDPGCL